MGSSCQWVIDHKTGMRNNCAVGTTAGSRTIMHVTSMFHVAVNCSDFERSRRFYEALGFRIVWEVPAEGTPEIARACGITPESGATGYRIRGALMALEGESTLIDLIEWVEPRETAAPYPDIRHLGIARIALQTTDLDADLAELSERGVELVGPPATVAGLGTQGTRFGCFKDPDGTILELVEVRT